MATFETQIEGLTGLSIDGSSSPTQTELSQFLKDGVVDVINRVIKGDRSKATVLGTITSESGSGTIIDGDIIDVWASDGTYDHPATRVSASIGKRAADPTSLLYRSKYNPYFYREGKRVIVKPNGGSVLHITYPSVAYDQETIYNIPNQYIYLVVLYSSIKALGNALSSKTFPSDVPIPILPDRATLTGIPSMPAVSPVLETISTSLPSFSEPSNIVMPASLSDVDITFDLPDFPTFIQPSVPVLSSSLPELPTFVQPESPTIDAVTITLPTDKPGYIQTSSSAEYSQIQTYIETEQDVELAEAKIAEMESKMKQDEHLSKEQLNLFNAENVEYQADLQKAIQDGQLASASESQSIQKYSAEIQSESARVQNGIQKYQETLSAEIQTFQAEIQKYGTEIQSQQQKLAVDMQEYQQKFTKDIQTYETETGYDVTKYNAHVQMEIGRFTQDLANENAKFQADLGKYQAEVQKMSSNNSVATEVYSVDIQKHTSEVQGINNDNQTIISKYTAEASQVINEFTNKLQKYSAEVQKAQADYQWMMTRQQSLLQEYYGSFAQGQSRPQQENQREPQQENQRE